MLRGDSAFVWFCFLLVCLILYFASSAHAGDCVSVQWESSPDNLRVCRETCTLE
jgi:hypothetical protein